MVSLGTTIIVPVGLKIYDSIFGANSLDVVWGFIVSVFGFLKFTFEVPLWLVIIVPVVSLIFGYILSNYIYNKKRVEKNKFLSYLEDDFGGILYRWEYMPAFSNKVTIESIKPYCKVCMCELVNYRCPNCNEGYSYLRRDDREIRALIKHRIDKKYSQYLEN